MQEPVTCVSTSVCLHVAPTACPYLEGGVLSVLVSIAGTLIGFQWDALTAAMVEYFATSQPWGPIFWPLSSLPCIASTPTSNKEGAKQTSQRPNEVTMLCTSLTKSFMILTKFQVLSKSDVIFSFCCSHISLLLHL